MHTFAQKQKSTQKAISGQSREVSSILHLQRTMENQAVQPLLQTNGTEREGSSPRFVHDFSQIPVHGNASANLQTKHDNLPGDKSEQDTRSMVDQVTQVPDNRIGLPYPLKVGLEALSGKDLSEVRVHKHSSKPAQLNALAYTQGQDIYVAPGQDRHLPHEAWHAVQQLQGRVKPTMQTKGLSINGDASLEQEADVMGARALRTKPATQAVPHPAWGARSTPVQRVVQRTIGDGHDLTAPWLAGDVVLEAIYDNERLMRNGSTGTAVKKVQQLLFYLGIDFPQHGADGIFGPETEAAVKEFQRAHVDEAGNQLVDDGIVGPLTMGALNREANRTGTNIGNLIRTAPLPALQGPPTASPVPLSVDKIDVIDSGVGAIGGYPPIVGGASLNTPGPFSDPVTGETKNSLQIHFHLDHGNSASLTPRRELQRTAIAHGATHENPPAQVLPPGVFGPPIPGGFSGLRVGPDGPAPHEIQRPTADKIVIADAPGINRAPTAADYPISYQAHFFLTVEDARNAPIARIKYDVLIRRTSLANIPNAENRVVATEKKDFVRGRNL
jgi:peptidoglycan hydrolase-like protein with peptidoglycan-binding domain